MRSCTSFALVFGAGEPGVQVKALSVIGFGRTSRKASVIPAFVTCCDVGQATLRLKCKPAFAADCVQSRCDGSLKSPTKNTGAPDDRAGDMLLSCDVMLLPRAAFAAAMACASVVSSPSRMSYGW